jgi:hypothetical protein
MKVDGFENLVSRLTDFLTCRFFSNGSCGRPRGNGPRGTSVVIALGLIAVITFFTIGIATTMISAIQNTASSKKALQAEYAAQGGVEVARKELKGLGVAYGGSAKTGTVYAKTMCSDGKNGENGQCGAGATLDKDQSVYFSYTLSPKDPWVGGTSRIIPFRGYGDAGDNCSARKNDPLLTDDNDPCNWNKIYYGDSVEIPLYLIKNLAAPDTATNFKNLGINRFWIYVRTPCESGYSVDCQRYLVNIDSTYFVQGNSVINWQISGSCNDEACEIVPVMDGSAIQEGRLQPKATVDFLSMEGQDSFDADKKQIIRNFLNDLDPWAGNNLNKPVLKLSFVKEVKDSGVSIPYLEYQISYTTLGDSLAAMYSTSIDGFGYGFRYSLSGVSGLGAGMFDFAVQN